MMLFRPTHPTPPAPTPPTPPPAVPAPPQPPPSYVTHLFTKLLHAADSFKVHRIVSFSGPPQTDPSLAEQGVTCSGKVPMEQVDSFVCTGAVDVAKLLRASRMGLLEQAMMLGGNVLVEEQWKCIINCSSKFRHDNSFQVHIRYSASATLSAKIDPHRPVALDKASGVPGLMTIVWRESTNHLRHHSS